MAAALAVGYRTLDKVCEALGIDVSTNPVRRVVVDIAVDGVGMVYVQRFLQDDQVTPFCDALQADKPEVVEVRDIAVDDLGNVSVKY